MIEPTNEESATGLFTYWRHIECGKEWAEKVGIVPSECPYPSCKPVVMTPAQFRRFVRNAQVGENEASAVAIHPVTGEAVYCFTQPGQDMPERYKNEGFEKVTFNHYKDLENFCKSRNLVNDVQGDWHKDDGYLEEIQEKKDKIAKEQRERYMEEREKVMKAYPELRRQGR